MNDAAFFLGAFVGIAFNAVIYGAILALPFRWLRDKEGMATAVVVTAMLGVGLSVAVRLAFGWADFLPPAERVGQALMMAPVQAPLTVLVACLGAWMIAPAKPTPAKPSSSHGVDWTKYLTKEEAELQMKQEGTEL